MSRKTWGITLTVLALVVVTAALLWYAGRDTVIPPEEQKGTELVEMLPAESRPEQVLQGSAQQTALPETAEEKEPAEEEYEYLLKNHDGYVAVYQLPKDELYEYTEVLMELLPDGLQEEIHNGKYLKNDEELYNFLENYTS